MTTQQILFMLAVVILAVIMTVLWRKGRKDLVKKTILALVVEAESKFGGGSGSLKFDYVASAVYNRLPAVVMQALTQEQVRELIEECVTLMRGRLAG